jgi:hypothetical protein
MQCILIWSVIISAKNEIPVMNQENFSAIDCPGEHLAETSCSRIKFMQGANLGLYLVVAVLIFGIAACSGSQEYGAGVDPDLDQIQVIDIFSDSSIHGSRVTLEGRIVFLCSSGGCWFYLQDDTGRIFVNLEPADITLPFREGRTLGSRVKVSGKVGLNHGQPLILADGLEIW